MFLSVVGIIPIYIGIRRDVSSGSISERDNPYIHRDKVIRIPDNAPSLG